MSTIIKHREFSNYKTYSMDLAGRPLTLEVGKLAELANASVLVRYGDTVVLVCATASAKPRDGIDFFPLSVDFEEKMYSVGRIPGSFLRREGRPGEKGVLTSRVIDRPIRPLFPGDFRNDVSIMATVMSVDHDCSPEIAALIGTSAALAISDIPWNGPVGALKVGLVNGELVLNPTSEQRQVSDLDVTVVSTGKKVVMIEAGANEVDNDTMFRAIELAHQENQKQVELINRMVSEIGKPKFDYPHADFNQELFDKIVEATMDEAKAAMDTDDKNVREARWIIGTSCSPRNTLTWTSISTKLPTNSRRRLLRPGCCRATVWTAAPKTRSVLWRPKWVCCPGFMDRVCLRAARPRCSACVRWTRCLLRRSWIPSGKRNPSAICITTISPATVWARPSRPAAPAAARSVTALSPSAPWCRCCPVWKNSPMPSVW